MVTAERLREVFDYNPDTGIFTRKVDMRFNALKGEVAGWFAKDGYVRISVDYKTYLAHRLAWIYCYDQAPPEFIDHINGKRNDNRIENLRLASHAQNAQNAKRRRDCRSGFKGVTPHGNNWRALIYQNGRNVSLGTFRDPAEAHAAYVKACKSRGEFARTK